MIKTIFLLLLTGMFISATAQQFEHFKVDTTGRGWTISSVVDDTPDFKVDKKAEYPFQITNDVNNIGRKTLQALPIDIKKEFVKTRVTVYFSLNAKGDVYHIIFRGGQAGISLTETQWLKVFDSFHQMKSEMVKLLSSENSNWEVRWVYPVSRYLRNADN